MVPSSWQVWITKVRACDHPLLQSDHGEGPRSELQGKTDDLDPASQERLLEYFEDFFVIITKKDRSYVPQESSFLVLLKVFDVVRRTNSTLDGLQECQIND